MSILILISISLSWLNHSDHMFQVLLHGFVFRSIGSQSGTTVLNFKKISSWNISHSKRTEWRNFARCEMTRTFCAKKGTGSIIDADLEMHPAFFCWSRCTHIAERFNFSQKLHKLQLFLSELSTCYNHHNSGSLRCTFLHLSFVWIWA